MAGKQYGQAMAVSSKPMMVSPLSPTLQPVRYILSCMKPIHIVI